MSVHLIFGAQSELVAASLEIVHEPCLMNDHVLASDCRDDSLVPASIAAFKTVTSKGRVQHT